jgi:hypothetical protein
MDGTDSQRGPDSQHSTGGQPGTGGTDSQRGPDSQHSTGGQPPGAGDQHGADSQPGAGGQPGHGAAEAIDRLLASDYPVTDLLARAAAAAGADIDECVALAWERVIASAVGVADASSAAGTDSSAAGGADASSAAGTDASNAAGTDASPPTGADTSSAAGAGTSAPAGADVSAPAGADASIATGAVASLAAGAGLAAVAGAVRGALLGQLVMVLAERQLLDAGPTQAPQPPAFLPADDRWAGWWAEEPPEWAPDAALPPRVTGALRQVPLGLRVLLVLRDAAMISPREAEPIVNVPGYGQAALLDEAREVYVSALDARLTAEAEDAAVEEDASATGDAIGAEDTAEAENATEAGGTIEARDVIAAGGTAGAMDATAAKDTAEAKDAIAAEGTAAAEDASGAEDTTAEEAIEAEDPAGAGETGRRVPTRAPAPIRASDVSCDVIVGLIGRWLDGDMEDEDRDAYEQHLLFCPPCLVRTGKTRRALAALRAVSDPLRTVSAPLREMPAASPGEDLRRRLTRLAGRKG